MLKLILKVKFLQKKTSFLKQDVFVFACECILLGFLKLVAYSTLSHSLTAKQIIKYFLNVTKFWAPGLSMRTNYNKFHSTFHNGLN